MVILPDNSPISGAGFVLCPGIVAVPVTAIKKAGEATDVNIDLSDSREVH